MKDTPPGWPRISSALYYEDPAKAIEWLCRAFGFQVQLKVEGEGGRIEHSELVYGGGLVMVAGVHKPEKMPYAKAPSQVSGGNTQNMMVYVDDVEAHCARAREAGAKITNEMQTHDYGDDHWADKGYECSDMGGHHWWFFQRMKTGKG